MNDYNVFDADCEVLIGMSLWTAAKPSSQRLNPRSPRPGQLDLQ